MDWSNWAKWTLMLLGVVVIAMACSDETGGEPTIGSESHFLEQCEATRDCSSGLACHCGVCTSSCADDLICSALGEASCAPAAELAQGCAESVSWTNGLCVAECAGDADCGEGMSCSATGWCQRRPSEQCDTTLEATPRYVDYTPFTYNTAVPHLSQGQIYYQKRVDHEDGGSVVAFQLDASTHETTRLTESSEDVVVRAAARGKLLLSNPNSEISADLSSYDVASGARSTFVDSNSETIASATLYGEPRQFFDGERVLTSHSERVFERQVSTWELVSSAPQESHVTGNRPVLTPQGFAYASGSQDDSSDNSPIKLHSASANGRTSLGDPDQHNHFPYADGDDLYWVTEQAVYVAKDGTDVERIDVGRGRCAAPHASNGRAVFACANVYGEPIGAHFLGDEVYVYDGQRTRMIAKIEGDAFAWSARIGEHGVVWLEYGERAFSSANNRGKLMYYDLEYDELFEIDQVDGPCTMCGQATLPVSLSIEGDIVAWNHAGTAFGYTTIRRSQECRE